MAGLRKARTIRSEVWALWNRGLAWKGLGEVEKAETDEAQAKEIDPTFKPAR
jgi:hypothetical protein